MPDSKLIISKNNLSITYNVFDGSLYGDTQFNIRVVSDSGEFAELESDSVFTFSPNNVLSYSEVSVLSGIDIPTEVGNYNFSYNITLGDNISRSISILLKVINDNTTPPDENYHLKYWLEYQNTEDECLMWILREF